VVLGSPNAPSDDEIYKLVYIYEDNIEEWDTAGGESTRGE